MQRVEKGRGDGEAEGEAETEGFVGILQVLLLPGWRG
jgi:hypothetical protein